MSFYDGKIEMGKTMTKKKRCIKTIEDIKYCEENGRTIWSAIDVSNYYYEFSNGVWCRYRENDKGKEDNLIEYNCRLCVSSNDTNILYYYEEESEEQQEASEKDVGKLCWFYTEDDTKEDERDIGILTGMPYERGDSRHYEMDNTYYYNHCRRLSPAEVAEMTGYKVKEKAK